MNGARLGRVEAVFASIEVVYPDRHERRQRVRDWPDVSPTSAAALQAHDRGAKDRRLTRPLRAAEDRLSRWQPTEGRVAIRRRRSRRADRFYALDLRVCRTSQDRLLSVCSEISRRDVETPSLAAPRSDQIGRRPLTRCSRAEPRERPGTVRSRCNGASRAVVPS